MNVMTDDQRSAEWFQARVGKATASRFKDVIGKRKDGKGYLANRYEYLIEVVTERLTGNAAMHFATPAMQWGIQHEATARALYAERFEVQVEEVGFIQHPHLDAGASPDGLVDWDGLIEIKCPYNSTIHVETMMHGMPADHMAQIQGQLWITEKEWCDFVSFDPRMPPDLQLYVQRIERDGGYHDMLRREIGEFLADVDAKVAILLEKSK